MMKIVPGIGVGDIRFGMLEKEAIQQLGCPDKVDEFKYLKNGNDWYRELTYSILGLTLSFNSDDNFLLGHISITKKGHTLFSEDLFGFTIDMVKSFLSKITNEQPKYEA